MGHIEHKTKAPAHVGVMVVTVSDSRTKDRDYSGLLIKRMFEEAGHKIAQYHIIKDDPEEIRTVIKSGVADSAVEAIVINGGTGLSSRDNTFEVISAILEKKIDGFGELFRSLSYIEIGPAAILSRAVAGTAGGRVIISIPGAEQAVTLAMEKIILQEIGHMVYEVTR